MEPDTPLLFDTPRSTLQRTPMLSAFALFRREAQIRKTMAQQLDELSIEAIPVTDDIQSLPRINVKGQCTGSSRATPPTHEVSDDHNSVLELQVAASKRPWLEPVMKAKAQRAKELALAYIINTNQPFLAFSIKYMKELLNLFDPALAAQLALGQTSFQEDLLKLFKRKRAEIKADLRDALSTVHLPFDLWTSPNRHAMIGIFGHYIDKNQQQQNRLLALQRQAGAYSGENIAKMLKKVINK
ncbi:hypothetical protein S40285_04023 [Stachybotrys chlorohalonatus IBT 40285]|uniref:Uncharacterized protein n=1 Tax=Stachybotrys chlorohalonatus (strain IBT 40285) TaxID=1283841 RepID=A0A084R0B6_STAC4|nr:hypothetical protein S40285_04023 [Stachybotrys chlorohalonata IBT 40285]